MRKLIGFIFSVGTIIGVPYFILSLFENDINCYNWSWFSKVLITIAILLFVYSFSKVISEHRAFKQRLNDARKKSSSSYISDKYWGELADSFKKYEEEQ